jgi:hypothetical protein
MDSASSKLLLASFRLRPRSLGNKMPDLTSNRPILTLRLPLNKLAQLARQRHTDLLGFHQQSSIVEDNESFAAISNAQTVRYMHQAKRSAARSSSRHGTPPPRLPVPSGHNPNWKGGA